MQNPELTSRQFYRFLHVTALILWCLCLEPGLTRTFAKEPPVQPYSTEKMDDTPDLMQSLPAAKLPYKGAPYCGPVAVSNSLVWLANQGYYKLAPDRPVTPFVQGKLARELGSYMKTTRAEGTSVSNFLNGLANYIDTKGYKVRSLLYQGWEEHPNAFGTGVEQPDLNWIKRGVNGKSSVWLKIGWYKKSQKDHRFRRFAGHWVTLVGYGKRKDGKTDPGILIIHDPAPRSGPETSHDYVTIERMPHGTLVCGNQAKQAEKFFRLGGDLKIKRNASCGILDGAVVLKMGETKDTAL